MFDFFALDKLTPGILLQKERSPGIYPGFVWFRVPKVAPGKTRHLRWWAV
jgi:hypothetical protein